MANFALLWKARIIDRYKREYEQEKINSVLLANVEIPKKTLMQKWSHYSYNTRRRLTEKFRDFFPEGSTLANFFVYLTTDQTFANFLMKSVIGFIAGIVSTYLSFMFFVFQLSISLMHATIMSSIMGVLLTLGLAFSYRVRCLVFLSIPQFFSRVGRYTLTCYALVLILTGPATNTLKNSEVLSESMACSQEQIKNSVKHITDSISNPYNALKDWVGLAADGIRGIAAKLRTSLVATHRVVIAIAHVLESSYLWLKSVTNTCNKELGTPYHHCLRVLHEGIINYMHSSPLKSQCLNSSYLADVACDSLKPYARFCGIADYTRTTIVATMKRRLKDFVERFQSPLRVKVHVHHSYSFSSNASQSASQVAAGIVTEIRNRADPLLTWLSWSSCVTSLFLFLIIFRAKNYQHMYETRSRFDNRYITKELRNLDFERLKEGKETVLPLNRIEKTKYITTTSFRLLASEKVFLERSVIYMIITTCKLLIHIVADYSLYWVLVTIRYHGRFQTPLEPGPPDAGVQVSGAGPLADLMRSLINVLTLPLCVPPPSVVTCLPNPHPPDVHRYAQIGVLICLLWSSALFEPYGLRLRHVIMGLYRPERAKARAQWLYNHILRTRGGLMKFARRKLHKEYKYLNKEQLTFVEWLDSQIPCWWLRYLLGTLPKEPCCLLCGIAEEDNGVGSELCRCDTPNCPGIYCAQCYSDLGELCTICLSPVDYGDLSDISMEKGSSEDSSSDDQDFDDQTEPDEESKLIGNFYDRNEGDIQNPESSTRKYDTQIQWLVFQSISECSEECQPIVQKDESDGNPQPINRFRRKANLIRSLKYCNPQRELVTSKLKIIPLKTTNENFKDTCMQDHFCNKILEQDFNGSTQPFPWAQKGISSHHTGKNKRVNDSKRLWSNSSDIGTNYKYKRKEKMRMRNISKERLRQSLSVDKLTSKMSRLQYRKVNFSTKNLRHWSIFVTRFINFKNIVFRKVYSQKNARSSSNTSFYSNSYQFKLKSKDISITRVTQPNDFAQALRNKYLVFRCKSKNEVRSNIRMSTKESNSCSCKFLQPQNVASYCKGLCFTKSSKSSDNDSQRPFSDKEKNDRPKKNTDKNGVPEKTDPNKDNKAGKGDNHDEEKLDSSSACYCMKRLRKFCGGRDKGVSYTPCSLFRKIFRKNSSKVSSTVNHKRRKKDESDIEEPKIVLDGQSLGKTKEDDVARIYRISTYFGQQEWMKRQFGEANYLDSNKKRFLETQSDITLHRLKLHPGTRAVCFDKIVKINDSGCKKRKPKLDNRRHAKDFVLKGNLKKPTILTTNDNVTNRKSILTHKWFDNYYSLLPATSALSLKTLLKAKKAAGSMSTDFGMSRSLRYYCSIGNTEFDQMDCPDEFKSKSLIGKTCMKETTILPVKVESEYTPLKGCCYSSEELTEQGSLKSIYFPIGNAASSIAFNLKTEFDLMSRPVRNIKIRSVKKAMSDRILSLRIRNPFPLVKDFYSGLIDSKMRRASDRSKDVKEVVGKSKAVAVHPKRKAAFSQSEGLWDNEEVRNDNKEYANENEPVTTYEKPKTTTLDSANETGVQFQASNQSTQDEPLQSQNLQCTIEAPQSTHRKRMAAMQTLNHKSFTNDYEYKNDNTLVMSQHKHTQEQTHFHSQNLQCSMEALQSSHRQRYAAIQTASNPKSMSKECAYEINEPLRVSQHTHTQDQTHFHSQNLQCSMEAVHTHRQRLAGVQTSLNHKTMSKACAYETDGPIFLSQHTRTHERSSHQQSHNQQCSMEPLRVSQGQQFAAMHTSMNEKFVSNTDINEVNKEASSSKKPRIRYESINRAVATSYSLLPVGEEKFTMNQTVNTVPDLPPVPPPRTPEMIYNPIDEYAPYDIETPGPERLPSRKARIDSGAVKPTYAPTKTHSKRDSKMRPFIFKPSHTEDNYPEDPTLPCQEIGPLSPCSPYRGEREEPNPCEELIEPQSLCCDSLDASRDPAHCFRRSVEEDCAVKDVVREFYKKTIATPNCVFKIPDPKQSSDTRKRMMEEEDADQRLKTSLPGQELGRSSSITIPKVPSVKSRTSRPSRDQLAREQLSREKLSREKPSREKLSREKLSREKLSREKLSREQPPRPSRAEPPARESVLRQRGLESKKSTEIKETPPVVKKSSSRLGRLTRGSKAALKSPTSHEKSLAEKAKQDERARKLLDEQNKAKFKRAAVIPDSDLKHGKDKAKETGKQKKKTKAAQCQCSSSSPPISTTLVKSSKHRRELYQGTDSTRSTEEGAEKSSSRQNTTEGSSSATRSTSSKVIRPSRVVPRSVPSAFPKVSSRSSSKIRQAWNVQSESEIMGVSDAVRNVYATTSKTRMPTPRQDTQTATKDLCACTDKVLPLRASAVSTVNTCSKSSCCSCISKRKRKHRNDRNRRRSSVLLTKVPSPSTKAFHGYWPDVNKDVPRETNTFAASRPKYLIKKDQLNLHADIPRHSYTSFKKPRQPTKEPRRKNYDDACDDNTEYHRTSKHTPEISIRCRKHTYHRRMPKHQRASPVTPPLIDDSPSDDCKKVDQRPVKQSRPCDSAIKGYFKKDSAIGDAAAIAPSADESSAIELSKFANCAECLSAKRRTRDTLSGGRPEEPCQCLKQPSYVDPKQIDKQKLCLPKWSKEIECNEIKCYLRSICKNCKCDEHLVSDPPLLNSNSHVATALLHRGKANSELRRYLQSKWGTCRCGKIQPLEDIDRLSIDNNDFVQNQRAMVGLVDVDSSLMGMCKNCNCVKKKLFLESCSDVQVLEHSLDDHFSDRRLGKTPNRAPSFDTQTENQLYERRPENKIDKQLSPTRYGGGHRDTMLVSPIEAHHSSEKSCLLKEPRHSCKACLNKAPPPGTQKLVPCIDPKTVADQTQIFPEKLSCGNEIEGTDTENEVCGRTQGSCIYKRKHSLLVQREPKNQEPQSQANDTYEPEKLSKEPLNERRSSLERRDSKINPRIFCPVPKCYGDDEPETPQRQSMKQPPAPPPPPPERAPPPPERAPPPPVRAPPPPVRAPPPPVRAPPPPVQAPRPSTPQPRPCTPPPRPCPPPPRPSTPPQQKFKLEVKAKKAKSKEECGCPTFEKLLEQEILQKQREAMRKQRFEAPHKSCQMPQKQEDCSKLYPAPPTRPLPKQTTRSSSSDCRIPSPCKPDKAGGRHRSAPGGGGQASYKDNSPVCREKPPICKEKPPPVCPVRPSTPPPQRASKPPVCKPPPFCIDKPPTPPPQRASKPPVCKPPPSV